MSDHLLQIIIAIFTSNALFVFIEHMIDRHDERDEDRKSIKKKIADLEKAMKDKFKLLEKDTLRTQLLFLIIERPMETQEILTIAEHYFKDLKGNWYMTSIFYKWCKEHSIEIPIWFNVPKEEEEVI